MPHPLLLIPTRAELSCSANVFLPPNSLSISTLGLISPLSCSSDDFTGHFDGPQAAFPGCPWFQMFLGFMHLWLFYGFSLRLRLHGRCFGRWLWSATVWVLMFLCGQLQNGHVSPVTETIRAVFMAGEWGGYVMDRSCRGSSVLNHRLSSLCALQ